jgi:DNA-binding FadR family transcriptional regulator
MGDDLSGKAVASEVSKRGLGHQSPISSRCKHAVKATPALRSLNRIEQSFAEHDRIVTAIVNGNSSEAEQALWDHITIQADRFHDFLAGLSRDR